MKFVSIALSLLLITCSVAISQTKLAKGQQPQIAADSEGQIRLVFGDKDKIFYSVSSDNGKTFSTPIVVGQVPEMHLGMTRGPKLASSKDYSVVTAMDKKGNIHSFQLNHKSNKWDKIKDTNDVDGSAPEGLMSITADSDNNFYAVWLDLRDDRQNNVCYSKLSSNSKEWSKNRFIYKSPESHVCECCKPSIEAKGQIVSVMFRNWLRGSRDLYLTTSLDGGKTFSEAQKLGNGTWPLNGCPMDGGGLSIDSNNQVHTAWQRQGIVFYAKPNESEQKIGDGRHVSMSGHLVSWENGSELIMKTIDGQERKLGQGTALTMYQLQDKSVLAVWERDDQIVFKKI